jgi:hypothetical protein
MLTRYVEFFHEEKGRKKGVKNVSRTFVGLCLIAPAVG